MSKVNKTKVVLLEAKQVINNISLINKMAKSLEEDLGFIFFRKETVFKSPEELDVVVINDRVRKMMVYTLLHKNAEVFSLMLDRIAPSQIIETQIDVFLQNTSIVQAEIRQNPQVDLASIVSLIN